jgi:two-component system chemotaxis response regulator CheY
MDKVRVLIIDDSSVMRKIVERSLRQAGLELEKVVEAANGAEALAALQDNVVDLILCDINMPVMDGLEFVRQVAAVETAKGVPIVMITTEGSESRVVAALSAGARGYIRKPFTPDQVKEHVLSLLGRNREYGYLIFRAGSQGELAADSRACGRGGLRNHAGLPVDAGNAIRACGARGIHRHGRFGRVAVRSSDGPLRRRDRPPDCQVHAGGHGRRRTTSSGRARRDLQHDRGKLQEQACGHG